MAKKKLTYEQASERLEQIVSRLEDSGITLEESVNLYKEGMEMALLCKEKLEAAQNAVYELKKDFDGDFYLKPFNREEAEE